MYAQFFGLRELPFNNTPDPRFFYSTPDHEEAMALLIYAISERKEFALLTGDVGAGKTLVSRMVLRQFGPRIMHATINHAVRNGPELLEVVCSEFGLPVGQEFSQAQLTRSLHDFLLQQFAKNTPVVLVLDEAQNLPMDAFEQLRMIGNLESDNAKLLQTLIVGQPELRALIASPALRQLSQRIFRSFHLPSLNRVNTEKYILHRLTVAGASGATIFDSSAIDSIFAASDGLPRVINTLCDNAMLSAFSGGKRSIDRVFMDMVVSQTQAPRSREIRVPSIDQRHAPLPSQTVSVAATPPPVAHSPVIQPTTGPLSSMRQFDDRFIEPRFDHERSDELVRRFNQLEEIVRASSNTASQRTQKRQLDEVTTQATAILGRVDVACRELRQRELNVERLIAAGKSIVDEMHRVVAELRSTGTEARSAQRKVVESAHRLGRSSIQDTSEFTAPRFRTELRSAIWPEPSSPPVDERNMARPTSAITSAPSDSHDVMTSTPFGNRLNRLAELSGTENFAASNRLEATVDNLLKYVESAAPSIA